MSTEYVEHREGFYRVAGTRVSLDSIVYAFLSGQSAESIAQSFPVLTLEQVYGAITFYLANRETIDRYLEAQEGEYDAKRVADVDLNQAVVAAVLPRLPAILDQALRGEL